MAVVYEWDAETVSDDGHEDVLDHSHRDTALAALKDIDQGDSQNMRLVLVRDDYSEDEGLVDRTWAYVEGDQLPMLFSDAYGNELYGVPRRFHVELRRALANR